MLKVELAFSDEELDLIQKALLYSDIGDYYSFADKWFKDDKRKSIGVIRQQICTYLESTGVNYDEYS